MYGIKNIPKILKQLACICKHGFKKKRVYSDERGFKHQSSKKRVSNSKFRNLICRVSLLIFEEYLSSYYIHVTFNGFRDFYCYYIHLEKVRDL